MGDAPAVKLTALALNCTLKPSSEASSTDKILKELLRALCASRVWRNRSGSGSQSQTGFEIRKAPLMLGRRRAAHPGHKYSDHRNAHLAWTAVQRCQTHAGTNGCLLEETDAKKRMPSFGKVGIAVVTHPKAGIPFLGGAL
jgi:hypothetical protein